MMSTKMSFTLEHFLIECMASPRAATVRERAKPYAYTYAYNIMQETRFLTVVARGGNAHGRGS